MISFTLFMNFYVKYTKLFLANLRRKNFVFHFLNLPILTAPTPTAAGQTIWNGIWVSYTMFYFIS